MYLPAEQVGQRRTRPFIRNMDDINTSHASKQGGRQMRTTAIPRGCVVVFTGTVFCKNNQFFQ